MAAHRVQAIGKRADGEKVNLFFPSRAEMVDCVVPNEGAGEGEPPFVTIPLDAHLNNFADEINEIGEKANAGAGAGETAAAALSAANNADSKASQALAAASDALAAADAAAEGSFDFDNAAAMAGVTRTTEFAAEGLVTEVIKRTATGVKVAERVTTFAGESLVTTVTTVYDADGATVLKQTTATAEIGDSVVETVV